MIKDALRALCPPLLWKAASATKEHLTRTRSQAGDGSAQDLGVYWEEKMVKLLHTWGEGNTWHEIELLLAGRQGKILDVGCGTGVVMRRLRQRLGLDVYGCDISDRLLAEAARSEIPEDRLTLCDATQTNYDDKSFEYTYSIGCLEHFTEEGINLVATEMRRITRNISFHMVPISRSGQDEGWLKTYQSFFNNNTSWWARRFEAHFSEVLVLDSIWNDQISVGKWFVCGG